jgi:hypothetical protein
MATGEDQIERYQSVTDWWLIPRRYTLPMLLFMFACIGQGLWVTAPSLRFLSFIFGFATPFCMTCAAFVWAMRDKAGNFLINDQLSSEQYRVARRQEDAVHRRSMALATATAFAGLFSSFPTLSKELLDAIWQWMVIGSSMSVAFSVYAYLLAYSWDRELRTYRDKKQIEYKTTVERRVLFERIEREQRIQTGTAQNWSEGPSLEITPTTH